MYREILYTAKIEEFTQMAKEKEIAKLHAIRIAGLAAEQKLLLEEEYREAQAELEKYKREAEEKEKLLKELQEEQNIQEPDKESSALFILLGVGLFVKINSNFVNYFRLQFPLAVFLF